MAPNFVPGSHHSDRTVCRVVVRLTLTECASSVSVERIEKLARQVAEDGDLRMRRHEIERHDREKHAQVA